MSSRLGRAPCVRASGPQFVFADAAAPFKQGLRSFELCPVIDRKNTVSVRRSRGLSGSLANDHGPLRSNPRCARDVGIRVKRLLQNPCDASRDDMPVIRVHVSSKPIGGGTRKLQTVAKRSCGKKDSEPNCQTVSRYAQPLEHQWELFELRA